MGWGGGEGKGDEKEVLVAAAVGPPFFCFSCFFLGRDIDAGRKEQRWCGFLEGKKGKGSPCLEVGVWEGG